MVCFKKWANTGLFFLSFSHHNFNNTNWKKHRWCAWDSNPGSQDGRAQMKPRSYGGHPLLKDVYYVDNLLHAIPISIESSIVNVLFCKLSINFHVGEKRRRTIKVSEKSFQNRDSLLLLGATGKSAQWKSYSWYIKNYQRLSGRYRHLLCKILLRQHSSLKDIVVDI